MIEEQANAGVGWGLRPPAWQGCPAPEKEKKHSCIRCMLGAFIWRLLHVVFCYCVGGWQVVTLGLDIITGGGHGCTCVSLRTWIGWPKPHWAVGWHWLL